MSRFNRDYQLLIQTENAKAIEIQPPFRVAFNGEKSIDGSLNKLNIKIYNLREDNRLALTKDEDSKKLIQISFKAGYEGSLETIFKGSVDKGRVTREGTDFICDLECSDGGFDNRFSFTSKTVRGGNVVDAILQDTPNTRKGKINARKNLVRPKVLVGSSFKLINDHIDSDETWFIDNGSLNILKANQVISNFIPVVNAASGLKGTPSKEEKNTVFESLMNPALIVGGRCELESVTAAHLNGIYRNESIGYSGDTDASDWFQVVKAKLIGDSEVL